MAAELDDTPKEIKRISIHSNVVIVEDDHLEQKRRQSSFSKRSKSYKKRKYDKGCRNPETRQRIGGVVFFLGVISGLVGVIMTIIAATDNSNERKYPKSFIAVGPTLISISFLCVIFGVIMISLKIQQLIEGCLNFDDYNGCCRVYFPKLSQYLKPDNTIQIQKAALDALKHEPKKSVLKRQKWEFDTKVIENTEGPLSEIQANSQGLLNSRPSLNIANTRLVTLHSQDSCDDTRNPTPNSPTPISPTDSFVSLRHCKVYPETNIWWTDDPAVSLSEDESRVRFTTEL